MIRFYGGDGTLLLIQFCAVLFIFGWTVVIFTPFTFFLRFINCLRIDALEEEVGMDISRHKGPAYSNESAQSEAIMELAASRRNSIDLSTSGRGSKKAMDLSVSGRGSKKTMDCSVNTMDLSASGRFPKKIVPSSNPSKTQMSLNSMNNIGKDTDKNAEIQAIMEMTASRSNLLDTTSGSGLEKTVQITTNKTPLSLNSLDIIGKDTHKKLNGEFKEFMEYISPKKHRAEAI